MIANGKLKMPRILRLSQIAPLTAGILFAIFFAQPKSFSQTAGQVQTPKKQDATQVQADGKAGTNELRGAIQRLGNDRFNVRQQAMETLWQAGEKARPLLEDATRSSDRETVSRAKTVLHRFAFGLYADTPPETARWINSFRFGDFEEKQAVLDHFREQGEVSRLVQLVAAEKSKSLRQKLSRIIVADIRKYASQLPARGAEKEWDALLGLGAHSDDGMRHYAAFLVLTLRDDEKLVQLQDKLARNKDLATARQIIWIHRAAGDLASAQAVAHTHALTAFELDLAYEARDWLTVDRLIRKPLRPGITATLDIQTLGFEAASRRLLHDDERFVQTMTTIGDMASSRKGFRFFAAEAMMINGYVEDGVALVTETSRPEGFRLLVRQGKFRQAFDQIGLGSNRKERAEWFENTLKESTQNQPERDDQFELLTHACRAMYTVGMGEEMLDRLTHIATAVQNDKSRSERLIALAKVANDTGHRDAARRLAADSILGGRSAQALGVLFPNHTSEAVAFWRFIDVDDKSLGKVERVQRLEQMLTPSDSQKLDAERLKELSDKWKKANGNPASKGPWYSALAEIQLIHGDRVQALATLDEVAEQSTSAAIRSAELKLSAKEYQRAEQAFSQVLKLTPNNPSALYLRGWVRKKLDRIEEGQADIDKARLIPLAVARDISELAQDLKRNGLIEEAVLEFERVLRLGEFKSWSVNDAAKQIGNSISDQDLFRSADHWERLLFSGFKRDSRFTAIEGYLQLSPLVHKTRARALLDEGKPFECSREIQAALAAIPNDISLAEDLVPLMDERGLKIEADLLFNQVFAANQRVLDDFPESPMHLNNLAWVSARCERRLKEALPLARKANELRPDSASYLDTLGEVLFRLGRKEEAIACAERCVKLSPESSFYREQLERFRGSKD